VLLCTDVGSTTEVLWRYSTCLALCYSYQPITAHQSTVCYMLISRTNFIASNRYYRGVGLSISISVAHGTHTAGCIHTTHRYSTCLALCSSFVGARSSRRHSPVSCVPSNRSTQLNAGYDTICNNVQM